MRTPDGRECPHYYEDFHRGRAVQECRLAAANPHTLRWRPTDCARCPVPAILQANASPHMRLRLTLRKRWLGRFGRKLEVHAWCALHDVPIENPYLGCPLDAADNDALRLFREALEKTDD